MKILVIGGTGVISTTVVTEMIKNDISVTCINRGKSKLRKNNTLAKTIYADINDIPNVLDAIGIEHYDAVFDFISYTTQDITNRFKWVHKVCDRYIFISSAAVYNPFVESDFSEDSPKINEHWPYSINKNKCEELLIDLCSKKEIAYTILRPAVTYDNTRIPYGIMPPYGQHGTFMMRILYGKPIITWNNAENLNTIMRVEDFAKATAKLLKYPRSKNEAFNIVGDESPSWREILNTIGEILKQQPITVDIAFDDYLKGLNTKSGELYGRCHIASFSNAKLKNVVQDYTPKISMQEGIMMTINHYQQNNYLDGIDYFYDGLHDRIVRKYHPQHKSTCKFRDYLGNATLMDHVNYLFGYYDHNILVNFTYRAIRKLRYLLSR